MPIFAGLDSSSSSSSSSMYSSRSSSPSIQAMKQRADKKSTKKFVLGVLTQLANAGMNRVETKLGLNDCARIVLNVNEAAGRAKRHRKGCSYIAEQAFQMVNAVDGALKSRAIDISQLLRDHVKTLRNDLEEIHTIIKSFSSWWTIFRSASSGLETLDRCQSLLEYDMQSFLLVLKSSVSNDRGITVTKRRRIPGGETPLKPRGSQSAWRAVPTAPVPKVPPKPQPTRSATAPALLTRKARTTATRTPGARPHSSTRARFLNNSPTYTRNQSSNLIFFG